MRSVRWEISVICLLLLLPSCGLVRAPFRVAGAMVDGTAAVGKSTYNASKKAFGKSEEEKQEEEKKRREEQAKKAKAERDKRVSEVTRHADATRAASEPTPPPPPADGGADFLPPPPDLPLPDDAPLPYGQ